MGIVQVTHPLVQHKLGLMRRADNSTKTFRELAGEVASLLTYEATADLETEDAVVDGWAGPVAVRRIKGRKVTLVPILRAGLGMLPGVLELIPAAKVSVVGMRRDEATLLPETYYENLVGDIADRTVIILDPMLATGGTLVATIAMLKAAGATRIRGLFLVAAPEGLRRPHSGTETGGRSPRILARPEMECRRYTKPRRELERKPCKGRFSCCCPCCCCSAPVGWSRPRRCPAMPRP